MLRCAGLIVCSCVPLRACLVDTCTLRCTCLLTKGAGVLLCAGHYVRACVPMRACTFLCVGMPLSVRAAGR